MPTYGYQVEVTNNLVTDSSVILISVFLPPGEGIQLNSYAVERTVSGFKIKAYDSVSHETTFNFLVIP